jgi:hypothetical protein
MVSTVLSIYVELPDNLPSNAGEKRMNTDHLLGDRAPLKWEKVHAIEGTIDNLVIQIQKSDGFWPRYSLQLMRNMGQGKYAPYFSVRIERDGTLVRIIPLNMDALADLVVEAEEWVKADAQNMVNQRLKASVEQRTVGR